MVALATHAGLDAYHAADDPTLQLLERAAHPIDARFATHRWLLESEPKRMLFWQLYGDLLQAGRRRSVLDVAGGYSAATRALLAHHAYRLIEVFAHDDPADLEALERELGRFWELEDWYHAPLPDAVDVVVANDMFPNVDQRLELFLERYLPRCAELRLSLTFYNRPRFYETKRVDADERLVVLAWDGRQLAATLGRFRDRFDGDLDELPRATESLFPNGRHVYTVTLRGDVQRGLRAEQ